jgi:hypothetical protein
MSFNKHFLNKCLFVWFLITGGSCSVRFFLFEVVFFKKNQRLNICRNRKFPSCTYVNGQLLDSEMDYRHYRPNVFPLFRPYRLALSYRAPPQVEQCVVTFSCLHDITVFHTMQTWSACRASSGRFARDHRP